VKDNDAAERRQLVVVVRVLVAVRVAPVGDVSFQRRQIAARHVTVITSVTSTARTQLCFTLSAVFVINRVARYQ